MLTRKKILLAQKNGTIDRIYADAVNTLIRKRYTIGDECAILRQRDEKLEEFNKYVEYAEECKKEVKEVIAAVIDKI